ncbi:MAG: hypothetical protein IKA36_00985, partial [Clostridia bacterium]|nr:hypothetical protein [Clostridia bacterium]
MEELKDMCTVKNCKAYGPSPIPQDGNWDQVKNINQLNGLTHGIGACAPQQGACKLTLNIKKGIIKRCLFHFHYCTNTTAEA